MTRYTRAFIGCVGILGIALVGALNLGAGRAHPARLDDPLLDHAITTAASVYGGAPSYANFRIYFARNAQDTTYTIHLSSSNPAVASVPDSLTYDEFDGPSKGVPITDYPVGEDTLVTFTATYLDETVSASMVIKTAVPKEVRLAPFEVVGGSAKTVTGKVLLKAPAFTGGVNVALSSSNTNQASVPASVFIAEGLKEATFPVTHYSVPGVRTPTIKATLNGVTCSKSLTLNPPQPSALKTSANQVRGGSATVVTGTVVLNAPAPTGDWVVALHSDNPAAASVPASVTVPAGAMTATFPVTHYRVTTQQIVALTATAGGVTVTKYFTVNP